MVVQKQFTPGRKKKEKVVLMDVLDISGCLLSTKICILFYSSKFEPEKKIQLWKLLAC